MLDRDAILAVADRPTAVVDVPEWGGQVRIRALSAAEAIGLSQQSNGCLPARVVCLGLAAEDGSRLLSDADGAALAAKSVATISRLSDAILQLSGMTQHGREDTEKN